jgi:hypothetical protein
MHVPKSGFHDYLWLNSGIILVIILLWKCHLLRHYMVMLLVISGWLLLAQV